MADIKKFRSTKALQALLDWAETVVEFLDVFEGGFEEDETANEGRDLQEQGMNLGLKRKGI